MATKKAEAWKLVPCDGDAHKNAYIDNCGTCAPRWQMVCVPVSCADIDAWRERLRSETLAGTGLSLKRRQKLADTRMRKAEQAAERERWAMDGPETAEFVSALKDAGVVK